MKQTETKYVFRIAAYIIFWILFYSISSYCSDTAKREITEEGWTESFDLESCEWSSHDSNKYFKLEPGYELVLEGMDDEDTVKLIITVLNDTEMVAGVQTRVVEERESVNGRQIEVSRNFLAFCENNQSVFYFGEDVDIYRDGQIISHDGGWRAGTNNNRAGLMMPGLPLLGAGYYQEIAPDIAMDRARIVSLDKTLDTPAGKFENCLVVEESTPLEPDASEYKIYAPGIGLIKDENLLLTRYGLKR